MAFFPPNGKRFFYGQCDENNSFSTRLQSIEKHYWLNCCNFTIKKAIQLRALGYVTITQLLTYLPSGVPRFSLLIHIHLLAFFLSYRFSFFLSLAQTLKTTDTNY